MAQVVGETKRASLPASAQIEVGARVCLVASLKVSPEPLTNAHKPVPSGVPAEVGHDHAPCRCRAEQAPAQSAFICGSIFLSSLL